MAGIHSLAVVGVVLLIWNPVSVLAVGSQLSFLATAVLMSLGGLSPKRQTHEAIQRLIEKNQSGFKNTAYKILRSLRWGIMVSGSVWVASAPLVASEFNRFVPIAVGGKSAHCTPSPHCYGSGVCLSCNSRLALSDLCTFGLAYRDLIRTSYTDRHADIESSGKCIPCICIADVVGCNLVRRCFFVSVPLM